MVIGSILESIGNTPIVRLDERIENRTYRLCAKLEFMNPSGSMKDRVAKYIVEQAEMKGLLKLGDTIVEATSGNTGISLSMIAAAKGYKMLVLMPEHMSGERIKIMRAFGANVCLTPKDEGFEGAVERADRISMNAGHFLANQFRNRDSVMAHYHTTGKEIVRQTDGRIDAFVAGVWTGGTLMGVGRALREKNPTVRLVAVEPEEAAVLSGRKDVRDHKIAGIGDGFVPEILDRSMIDRTIIVKSDDAVLMARKLCREHGLPAGISSGANVLASIRVLQDIGQDKRVVTILPDRTERYFSTDLHVTSESVARQCSNNCERRFQTAGSDLNIH